MKPFILIIEMGGEKSKRPRVTADESEIEIEIESNRTRNEISDQKSR
jgi:hypothetical protein